MIRPHRSELCIGMIALAIGIWLGISRGAPLDRTLLHSLTSSVQDLGDHVGASQRSATSDDTR